MTTQTWLEEHYPVPADQCLKKRAISHSLRKWEGLRGEAVVLHSLETFPLVVDGDSCALCHHYSDPNEWMVDSCEKCPLYKTLGYACDEGLNSPFKVWRRRTDPEPMIKALKRTLKKFPERA